MLFIYYYARQFPNKYLMSVIFVKKSDLIYNYDKFTYMKTYLHSVFSFMYSLYIVYKSILYSFFKLNLLKLSKSVIFAFGNLKFHNLSPFACEHLKIRVRGQIVKF